MEMTVKEIKAKSKDFCEFYILISLDSEIELWCSLWKARKIKKQDLQQIDLTDALKKAGDFFNKSRRPLLFFLPYDVQLPSYKEYFLL